MALAAQRPETWGEAVRRHVGPRNLNPLVEKIRLYYGHLFGTRESYRKLFDLEHPPEADRDIGRAQLLLMAAGYDPAAFGLPPDLPPGISAPPSGFCTMSEGHRKVTVTPWAA